MHRGLHKPMERGARGYPSTCSSTLIKPEILSKQPGPPLITLGASLSWMWLLGFVIYYLARRNRLWTALPSAVLYALAAAAAYGWWQHSTPKKEYALDAYLFLAVAFAALVLATQRSRVLASRQNCKLQYARWQATRSPFT
jgi:hypothetical protein